MQRRVAGPRGDGRARVAQRRGEEQVAHDREEEAGRAGFRYEAVTIDSTTRAGYFPGTKPIRIKLLAEHGTRRILGAQIVGEEGAAKRIDVLATAITARMTVDDVIDLDLAYAPPFSGVWDAVHIAARKGAQALDKIPR